jgi:hypothetical protein
MRTNSHSQRSFISRVESDVTYRFLGIEITSSIHESKQGRDGFNDLFTIQESVSKSRWSNFNGNFPILVLVSLP